MLFLPSISYRPPPPKLLVPLTHVFPLTRTGSFGISAADVVVPHGRQKNSCKVLCSISKVHNYGTVDYEKKPPHKWSSLYRKVSLMEDPSLGAATVLERWEMEEGKKLSKWELCRVAKELRKYRRFKLALDVYDWIAVHEDRYTFYSSDAAILLDLISKVKGLSSTEEYFLGLSEMLKDKRTYCALLNAYAYAKKKGKAEAVYETMKNNDYATEALVFNVMMTLYMNLKEHKKVTEIITEMRTRGIKLDTYSYNIWITTCAAMEKVDEMEKVLELMNSDESIVANWTTYSTLASMNIRLGGVEKAEKYLKEAENRVTGRDRTSFDYLLGLYSLINKKEEIHRIWKWYKSSFPVILNKGYHSVLSALVKVGDINEAEAIFEEWISSTSRYDPKICNILITYYVKGGVMKKAKACFQRMLDQGGSPNPTTWELLTEGYIADKQTSKALSCLKEAASVVKPLIRRWRPRLATVANFLVLCEEQDDRCSVDMLVEILGEAGCLENLEYKTLVSQHAGGSLARKDRITVESRTTEIIPAG